MTAPDRPPVAPADTELAVRSISLSDFSRSGNRSSSHVRGLRADRIRMLVAGVVAELLERGTPRQQWVAAVQSALCGTTYPAHMSIR